MGRRRRRLGIPRPIRPNKTVSETFTLFNLNGQTQKIYVNGLLDSKVKVKCMVDSGNKSLYTLLNSTHYFQAFPNIRLIPVRHEIRTAGGHRLNILGKPETPIPIRFNETSRVWQCTPLIIENLGADVIFNLHSLKRMGALIDLSQDCLFIGEGKKRLKVPLVEDNGSLAATLFSEIEPAVMSSSCKLLGKHQSIYYLEVKRPVGDSVFFKPHENFEEVATPSMATVLRDDTRKKNVIPVLMVNNKEHPITLTATSHVGSISSYREQEQSKREDSINALYGIKQAIDKMPDCGFKRGERPNIKDLDSENMDAIFREVKRMVGPRNPMKFSEAQAVVKKFMEKPILENRLLSDAQKQLVLKIFTRFANIIAQDKYDVGDTSVMDFEFDTGDSPPLSERVRIMNPVIKQEFAKTLDLYLKQGILTPANSPWAAPILAVPKRDGGYRFCVDLRRLNAVTKFDTYPIANCNESLSNQSLAEAKIFHQIDLCGAYMAIRTHPDCIEKLGIITPFGTYCHLRMPFGHVNAGQTYARLIDEIFRDMKSRNVMLTFFDDHLLHATNFLEAIFVLVEYLFLIEASNLRISPLKSTFFTEETRWLGHMVTPGKLSPTPEMTKGISDWPVPEGIKDLRTFLGKASYYRRFIPSFATIAAPLHQLTKKDVPFVWDSKCQESFVTLKQKLVEAPVLAQPQFGPDAPPFILDTDASGVGVGAVLSQMQDGEERPLGYYSQALSAGERNYASTKVELLAIVKACEHFKYYLAGKAFIIRTDNMSLKWLMQSKAIYGQLFRWKSLLAELKFDIEYRPGRGNKNADALSRRPDFSSLSGTDAEAPTEEDLRMYQALGMSVKGAVKSKQVMEEHSRGNVEVCGAVLTRAQAARGTVPEDIKQSASDLSSKAAGPTPKTQDIKRPDACEGYFRTPTSSAITFGPSKLQIGSGQDKDPVLKVVRKWIYARQDGKVPLLSEVKKKNVPDLTAYRRILDELQVHSGGDALLVRKPSEEGPVQLLVPEALRSEVVRVAHAHPYQAHPGIRKTAAVIRKQFYWPGCEEYIEKVVKGCDSCIRAKQRDIIPRTLLGKTSTANTERFSRWYIDVVEFTGRYPYLLTMQEGVTRYLEAYPLCNQTSESILNILTTEFIPRYGVGQTLISDQGANFTSSLIKAACEVLGVPWIL